MNNNRKKGRPKNILELPNDGHTNEKEIGLDGFKNTNKSNNVEMLPLHNTYIIFLTIFVRTSFY